MKSKSLNIVFLVIAGILLFFTNPSYNNHRTTVNNEFKKTNRLVGILGGGRAVGALSTYNDFLLFSTTEIDGKLLSVGVLSKVVVVGNMNI